MKRILRLFIISCALLVCINSSPLHMPLAPPPAEKTNPTLPNNKLRQDEDGADVPDVPVGLEAVAGPISQIISGTLSGNIGQLFNGITGTVTDQEAQPGVGTILTGVSIPLSSLWANGIAAGQKYFNITTQPPKMVQQTRPQATQQVGGVVSQQQLQTLQLLQQQQQTNGLPVVSQQQLAQLQQQNNRPAVAAVQPVRVAAQPQPTTVSSGDDDDEEESESGDKDKDKDATKV